MLWEFNQFYLVSNFCILKLLSSYWTSYWYRPPCMTNFFDSVGFFFSFVKLEIILITFRQVKSCVTSSSQESCLYLVQPLHSPLTMSSQPLRPCIYPSWKQDGTITSRGPPTVSGIKISITVLNSQNNVSFAMGIHAKFLISVSTLIQQH